jgi:hypothetical protein
MYKIPYALGLCEKQSFQSHFKHLRVRLPKHDIKEKTMYKVPFALGFCGAHRNKTFRSLTCVLSFFGKIQKHMCMCWYMPTQLISV